MKLEAQFLKRRLNAINVARESGRILDLACGAGRLNKILRNDKKLISLDISFSMLSFQNKGNSSRHFLVQSNALNLPFQDNSFELIVLSMNSIACFTRNRITDLFNEIQRVLTIGGSFIFDQINPGFINCDSSFEPLLTDGSFKALERLGSLESNGSRLFERKYDLDTGEIFFVKDLVTFHDRELLTETALAAGFEQCLIWDGYSKSVVHKKSRRWVFELRA